MLKRDNARKLVVLRFYGVVYVYVVAERIENIAEKGSVFYDCRRFRRADAETLSFYVRDFARLHNVFFADVKPAFSGLGYRVFYADRA